MSFEVKAWLNLNGGDDIEISVQVPNNATDDQIDEAVKNEIIAHLDWGWEDPYEEPYELYTDTYPCGCCMCCGCDCDWDYDEDEDWEDE